MDHVDGAVRRDDLVANLHEPAVPQHAQAAVAIVMGGDPQPSLTILGQRGDERGRQPVIDRVVGESTLLPPADAAVPGADPDGTVTILKDRIDVPAGEAVLL